MGVNILSDNWVFILVTLFVIIYAAVRLAINPLINKSYKVIKNKQDVNLIRLRDIGVLSNEELENIIDHYQNENEKNKNSEQYQRYNEVLNELLKKGYFSNDEYLNKREILNDYFNIEDI